MLSYKTCAVGMYQYSIHAPRNEYLRITRKCLK
jgi:hypothetical protein